MINKKLEDVVLSITDKFLYFPCLASRPRVEYPNFYWWRFTQGKGENKYITNTLYLPVADKSYKEIAENLYEALFERRKDLFEMPQEIRKQLYNVITTNSSYILIKNRDKYEWEQKLD